jgi:hypothetical protein
VLHIISTADGNEVLLPYAYWMTLDDEKLNKQALQLVLAFGLSMIVIDRDRPRDPKASAHILGTPPISTGEPVAFVGRVMRGSPP